MIDAAKAYILAHVRSRTLVTGLFRQDIPEYPRAAVREALLNAVAHRDYSGYKRGSQVQVKLFADRLEVRSPGGLFGDVTVDTLEDGQTTRNRRLMQMMEDLNLVENRGTGIDSMVAEMREVHMEPPRFEDDRSWFTVTFYNHILLMSGPDLAWLNDTAAALTLNDRQRLALLYMRHNQRITNSDYRRIHRVDRLLARRELQGIVGVGAAEMRGIRGGAHYELSAGTGAVARSGEALRRETVLRHVQAHGEITNRQCRDLLGLPSAQAAWRLLSVLVHDGALRPEGAGRGSKYVIPKRER
jgi:ATP-dependent DNA helicase RecG